MTGTLAALRVHEDGTVSSTEAGHPVRLRNREAMGSEGLKPAAMIFEDALIVAEWKLRASHSLQEVVARALSTHASKER